MTNLLGLIEYRLRLLGISGIALGILFLPGPMEERGTAHALRSPLLALTPAAPQSAGMVFEQVATDGLVVIEAENFAANTPAGAHTWTAVTAPAGYVGAGAMQALPDGVGSFDTGYIGNSPRLDFNIAFISTGTHYVWIRGISVAGLSGTSDSIHAGLNGAATPSAERINSFTDTGYTWRNVQMNTGAAGSINIPAPGVYTVNLWMREDGFTADRLLLTTTPNYLTNGDASNGPPESNQIPDPTPPAPTGVSATPGITSVTISWGAVTGATSYNVLGGTMTGGPYTPVATGLTATSYTATGLSSTTTYYYVVQAVNSFGTGPNSAEVSATPLPAPRPPPGPPKGDACGCSSVAWTFPSGRLWIFGLLGVGALLLRRRS